jgi:hypothetical protein
MPRRRVYNPSTTLKYFKATVIYNLPVTFLDTPTVQVTYGSTNSDDFLTKFQEYIFKIIDNIRDHISLDAVLGDIITLKQEITTKVQADIILQSIEDIILGVIDNIRDRVSLTIILQRIKYLKDQVQLATNLP